MSAEDNLSTVRGIYEAFGSGDVDAILAVVSDDVDWAADAAGDAAPWWGERSSKDEVGAFFAAIGENLEVLDFEPVGFAANDSNEVMVFLTWQARGRATGREIKSNLHHYWHLDADGKVDRYRGSEDTKQSAEALT